MHAKILVIICEQLVLLGSLKKHLLAPAQQLVRPLIIITNDYDLRIMIPAAHAQQQAERQR